MSELQHLFRHPTRSCGMVARAFPLAGRRRWPCSSRRCARVPGGIRARTVCGGRRRNDADADVPDIDLLCWLSPPHELNGQSGWAATAQRVSVGGTLFPSP